MYICLQKADFADVGRTFVARTYHHLYGLHVHFISNLLFQGPTPSNYRLKQEHLKWNTTLTLLLGNKYKPSEDLPTVRVVDLLYRHSSRVLSAVQSKRPAAGKSLGPGEIIIINACPAHRALGGEAPCSLANSLLPLAPWKIRKQHPHDGSERRCLDQGMIYQACTLKMPALPSAPAGNGCNSGLDMVPTIAGSSHPGFFCRGTRAACARKAKTRLDCWHFGDGTPSWLMTI